MQFYKKITMPLMRAALFIIFFWFGLLKVIGTSPASPLVFELLEKTMPFFSYGLFFPLFGLFEMAIGLVFLIRGLERVAVLILSAHLAMTALPLLLLPDTAWQSFMMPTLEGQYIVKNIALIALAIGLAVNANAGKLKFKKTACS